MKLSQDEKRHLVETDEDFIDSKNNNYSLKKYLEYSKKIPNAQVIAHFLCSTPEEIEKIYENIVEKARQKLKVKL